MPHSGIEHEIGSGLNDALKEIARAPQLLSSIAGPNQWAEVKPSNFGPEHDFAVDYYEHTFVFRPRSKAALQWCYKSFPEDCPRHGPGFVIEPDYIKAVVKAARRDKLMSLDDYTEACEEQNQLQFAEAGQDE